MALSGTIPAQVSLSVMLFYEAMLRQQSISKFATDLDVGTLSLRQLILGKTKSPRQKTLETLGKIFGLTLEEVHVRMALRPYQAPLFSTWLEQQMKPRFNRLRLVKTAQISDGALRNYLKGQTLPDADQAHRLALALDVHPLEMASIIVANQIVEAGGELDPPPPPPVEDEVSAEAMLGAEVAAMPATPSGHDESQLLALWRQLHPQARRATLGYIAMLLAER
ncbi:MAG: XRE family transcriptional regulator [Candidatus Viridilinea halotolerans]|uniref:XRE family transcriptional regulator n=1 Tax=Candidatus Viridilinea halotolerans TaxID=2491704 RepID=A0A426UAU7_9CHLR|nr:MAG: XRE family transcriptional regulator [Candidatus Viridilinea halotolerans]